MGTPLFACIVLVLLAFGCDAAAPMVCSPEPHEIPAREIGSGDNRTLELIHMHAAGFARYDALNVSLRALLEVRTEYGLTELDEAIREMSRLMCKRFGSYVQAKTDSEPVERLYPLALLPLCDEIGCVSCRLRQCSAVDTWPSRITAEPQRVHRAQVRGRQAESNDR